MEMIPCIKCKNDMPKLRKEKFGYNFCVNCSTVTAKRAVSVQLGEKDHTWNDIVIMDENEYGSFIRSEELINSKKK